MKKMWMVRAGRGADYLDNFIENNIVSIGWKEFGEIKPGDSKEKISEKLLAVNPHMSNGKVAISASQLYRFINEIDVGDYVVTYDPSRRVYHIGEVKSEPRYSPSEFEELPRIKTIGVRDQLFLILEDIVLRHLFLKKWHWVMTGFEMRLRS